MGGGGPPCDNCGDPCEGDVNSSPVGGTLVRYDYHCYECNGGGTSITLCSECGASTNDIEHKC